MYLFELIHLIWTNKSLVCLLMPALTMFIGITFPFFGGLLAFFGGFAFAPTSYYVRAIFQSLYIYIWGRNNAKINYIHICIYISFCSFLASYGFSSANLKGLAFLGG